MNKRRAKFVWGMKLALLAAFMPTAVIYFQGIWSVLYPSEFQLLCTQFGPVFVKSTSLDTDETPSPSAQQKAPCAFCLLDATHCLEASNNCFLVVVSERDKEPVSFYSQAFSPKSFLNTPQVRAPPLSA